MRNAMKGVGAAVCAAMLGAAGLQALDYLDRVASALHPGRQAAAPLPPCGATAPAETPAESPFLRERVLQAP